MVAGESSIAVNRNTSTWMTFNICTLTPTPSKNPKDMSIHKLAHSKYRCFGTNVSSRLIPNHSHGLRSEGRRCQILVKSIASIWEPVQKLPYLYTYAYKCQTSIQSLKKRCQLYLFVIIARESLDTFGSFTHWQPIECFMSGRPCLCHQQAFLDSMSWNLRQQAARLSCTWSDLVLVVLCHCHCPKGAKSCQIANSSGALSLFVRFCSYLPKVTPKKDENRLASCSSGTTRGGQWRRAAVPSPKPRPIWTQGHPQGFLLQFFQSEESGKPL